MKLLWLLLPAILLGIFLSSLGLGSQANPIPPLGSQANPYKINKQTTKVFSGYIPQNAPDGGMGEVTIPTGSKPYFEVDPLATTGTSVSAFKVVAKFYDGAGTVCKFTQNKSTGAYSPEVCQGSDGYMDIVYDGQPYTIANTKFLYALVGSPDGELHEAIWVTIPFVP
jgi:hypothetical protein